MWPNPQFPADLVTFTEEILHGKLYFLSGVKFFKSDTVTELNEGLRIISFGKIRLKVI